MPYLFTSESVSEGHPDKIADQISDAIVDHYIAFDPESKVAVETLVTTGQVVLAGEVKSKAKIDPSEIAREVINKIGYNKAEYMFDGNSCGILSAIHGQSPEINQGVDRQSKEEQGAGDQGIMFGYANNETDSYMPLALYLAHLFLKELAVIRKAGEVMSYLRPDAKSQVTIEYSDENKPIRLDTLVISTQHDPFAADDAMVAKITEDVKTVLIPKVKEKLNQENRALFDSEFKIIINPTGKFVIGGPHGDVGLTGRKIIVDTYGGKGAHGGGAFSGKDPSKVDRSAAYATRHLAKNLVAAGVADEILLQISYAIGVAQPVSMMVNTYGTSKVKLTDSELAIKLLETFNLSPYSIEQRLDLRKPIYLESAAYGHMGRTMEIVSKNFKNIDGEEKTMELQLFPWEELNLVDEIKAKLL